MDDSFSFGQPQHRSRTRTPRPRRRSEPDPPPKHAASRRSVSIDWRRLVFALIGLVLLAAAMWGFRHLPGDPGSEATGGPVGAASQLGNAADIQAKQTGAEAVQRAQSLYETRGSFEAVTARTLRVADPTVSYMAAASTAEDTVSVLSTPDGVGLAVLSSSGSCFYAYITSSGVTYGTGSACTGEKALDARAPAWPSQST
jgi:hypothetical protein